MDNKIKVFVLVVALLIIGTLATALTRGVSTGAPKPGELDTFAQCIKDSGAIFYGAFWCPHCQAQKKMFGTSVKFLPYVECSTPDANGQTQICIDNNITGYPTWVFPDGSKLSGEVPLATLSEKTSCPLPVGDDTTASPIDEGASSTALPAQ